METAELNFDAERLGVPPPASCSDFPEVNEWEPSEPDLFMKIKDAEELGREAGCKYAADFKRLYMTVKLAEGMWGTPAKEPTNPFNRNKRPEEHQSWWDGYRDTAYTWLVDDSPNEKLPEPEGAK